MASNHDDKSNMRKVALTSLAGTSIEWYDFFIYGTAAAIVFPKAFFPQDLPPMVLLIISFSTFAVGFVARPVGGIIFGHFGDRVGRKRTLVAALMMMGAATTLIGLLPTYGTIGIAAPLLLVLLRFVQGLAIGGQWGGAMLLVTESAPANKRGWYGAYAQAGAPVGVILANLAFIGVSMSMSDEAFMSWGWRLPFLASIILIGVSLFVQLRLEDTEAFKTLKAAQDSQSHSEVAARSPIVQALKKYPRTIMLAAGAFLSVQVTFYILIAFTVAYGLNSPTVNLSREAMLTAVLIASAVMVPTQFYFSGLSDRLGRKKVYRWGAILTGLWGFHGTGFSWYAVRSSSRLLYRAVCHRGAVLWRVIGLSNRCHCWWCTGTHRCSSALERAGDYLRVYLHPASCRADALVAVFIGRDRGSTSLNSRRGHRSLG